MLAGDIWTCLDYLIDDKLRGPKNSKVRDRATEHLWQGFEFYEAARTPRFDTRPLLYYYSFLNVAKAFLLARAVSIPTRAGHGVTDPPTNERKKVRLDGQSIKLEAATANHGKLMAELVIALGSTAGPSSYRVLDLLAQIPAIHRTYMSVGRGRSSATIKTKSKRSVALQWLKGPCFAPVTKILLLADGADLWLRVVLDSNSADTLPALTTLLRLPSFRRSLRRVAPAVPNATVLETAPIGIKPIGPDQAIARSVINLRTAGIWSVLTSTGYRHYLGAIPAAPRLPQLASIYGVMFYLGSLTRYRPHDYDTIASGRYAWLIEEYFTTQPLQFMYVIASTLAGTDIVAPLAKI